MTSTSASKQLRSHLYIRALRGRFRASVKAPICLTALTWVSFPSERVRPKCSLPFRISWPQTQSLTWPLCSLTLFPRLAQTKDLWPSTLCTQPALSWLFCHFSPIRLFDFFFLWVDWGMGGAIRFLHGSQKWHNLYRCQGIRTPRPLCCGLYGGWLRAGPGWMSLYFSIRRGLGSHRSAGELWGNVYRAGPWESERCGVCLWVTV